MSSKIVKVDGDDIVSAVFGSFDSNVEIIEKKFGVALHNRVTDDGSDVIVVSGDDDGAVADAYCAVKYLVKMAKYSGSITDQNVIYICDTVAAGKADELESLGDDCICVTMKGKPIKAKTVGQKQYVNSIKKNTVVLGIGPAGTGKTFLAVAMAVKALRDKQVSRIILTRPAIEAGEKLGFLPGDLQSKIDPYLRPLYDALFEMMGAENYQRQVEKGVIEVAPLAYMRGRTLDDSFIILDEAQNCTPEQMKMFLTRLGFNSKAVVTGDLTQTDLPAGQKSGLYEAVKILEGIDDIAIHSFTERDVVRHKLVQKIILAYEKYDREKREKAAARKSEAEGKKNYARKENDHQHK
ncbi:MAG: phosphate starvation-inducible protein PhoH [Ruminococcaceae bacterium]|nr:phosphate starvation-inducible protein PhoH [Oscillospiraceae bacterium]